MRNGCCGQGRGRGMSGCCGQSNGREHSVMGQGFGMGRRDGSCMSESYAERRGYGLGFGQGFGFREFLSKEEQVEILKQRKDAFEKEVEAMNEKIKELQG